MIFVEIYHYFGWFFATRIRIRFIEADPDPADQNETDPDPQHWFLWIMNYSWYRIWPEQSFID